MNQSLVTSQPWYKRQVQPLPARAPLSVHGDERHCRADSCHSEGRSPEHSVSLAELLSFTLKSAIHRCVRVYNFNQTRAENRTLYNSPKSQAAKRASNAVLACVRWEMEGNVGCWRVRDVGDGRLITS